MEPAEDGNNLTFKVFIIDTLVSTLEVAFLLLSDYTIRQLPSSPLRALSFDRASEAEQEDRKLTLRNKRERILEDIINYRTPIVSSRRFFTSIVILLSWKASFLLLPFTNLSRNNPMRKECGKVKQLPKLSE